jgi:hypothetical protein
MNRYSLLRSGNSALFIALSTLAAACTPQAADEAATADVATAESEAPSAEWRQLAANGEGEVVFIVDGESAQIADVEALSDEAIATVEVSRRIEGEVEQTEIRLVTREGAEAGLADEAADPLGSLGDFTGLLLVDGVVTDLSALESLDPAQIAEMRVFKGDGAAERYDDPRAADGVIEVTTRGS